MQLALTIDSLLNSLIYMCGWWNFCHQAANVLFYTLGITEGICLTIGCRDRGSGNGLHIGVSSVEMDLAPLNIDFHTALKKAENEEYWGRLVREAALPS